MKQFYHGRTECLRSVTKESVEFTKTFTCPKADNAKKDAALRKAIEAHVHRAKECKDARGVDRHWLGLKSIARHKEQWYPGFVIPEMFTVRHTACCMFSLARLIVFAIPLEQDRAYSKLFSSVLSTSNCGTRALDLFGFGPVVDDGFGLGYMIHPDVRSLLLLQRPSG